jgi:hypothetical protein
MKMLKKIYLKIRHWCCKVGLCNLDSCGCDCHENTPKTTVTSNAFKPHLNEVLADEQENNLKEMTKDREPAPIKKNGTGAISSIGRKSSHS